MTAANPFNFLDPRCRRLPANKTMLCSDDLTAELTPAERDQLERRNADTYFHGERTHRQLKRWAYDNFVYAQLPWDCRAPRADRVPIETRMLNIHHQELAKIVPCCTQSWYGHRGWGPAVYRDLEPFHCRVATLTAGGDGGTRGMPYEHRRYVGQADQADAQSLWDVLKPRRPDLC